MRTKEESLAEQEMGAKEESSAEQEMGAKEENRGKRRERGQKNRLGSTPTNPIPILWPDKPTDRHIDRHRPQNGKFWRCAFRRSLKMKSRLVGAQ